MRPAPIPLPIDAKLPEILDLLGRSPNLVIQADPGSGKTTRVPPSLLDAPFLPPKGEILVLEPRRLAARMAAQRVSDERGEAVGRIVGYQFRHERVTSSETRLAFMTEGLLMRRLLGDPQLKGVSTVVLDEFHERHLHGDVALAYLRRLQQSHRPDLRLVVMSATLDAGAVSTFLGGCPVLRAEGRRFDVAVEYLPRSADRRLEDLVGQAVTQLMPWLTAARGHALVFLPGMADIRRAESILKAKNPSLLVAPLHGELSKEEQQLALQPSERTKVILSTNVAESSLTIDGVVAVIDSGLERTAGYSFWSGVPTLHTRPISRASAEQRAGRAGRTAPGRCLRLYTKWEFDSRAAFPTPEIRRADLSQTVLELKSAGIEAVSAFQWFEAPSASALSAAEHLLTRLGALTPEGSLTELGRDMARVPAHPRLAKLLMEAGRRGVSNRAATLAAAIQEDRLEDIDVLAALADDDFGDPVFRRVRRQFLEAAPAVASKLPGGLSAAVLSAYPDRVARKAVSRGAATSRISLLMASGGSAWAPDSSFTRGSELFVVLDAQERGGQGAAKAELSAKALVPVTEDLLLDVTPGELLDRSELRWDESRNRVLQISQLRYGDIVLTESERPPEDLRAAARVLAKDGLHLQLDRLSEMSLPEFFTHIAALPGAGKLETLAARLALLAEHRPAFALPAVTPSSLADLIVSALEGIVRLEDARGLDVTTQVLATLPSSVQSALDALLPVSVTLAAGRRVPVQYELGRPPWIKSRLQDFFGMRQGPSIVEGRLPLTLHLLAPNGRPVQITTDLSGFWQRAYREVRRELSRNYPRHRWSENPLEGGG